MNEYITTHFFYGCEKCIGNLSIEDLESMIFCPLILLGYYNSFHTPLQKIIIEKGMDRYVHKTDDKGRNALYYAVSVENTEYIRFLLELGSSIFDKDIYGESAYDIATDEIKEILDDYILINLVKEPSEI